MNVEIRADAALFPEKEYISGIFVAVFFWWTDPRGTQVVYILVLLSLPLLLLGLARVNMTSFIISINVTVLQNLFLSQCNYFSVFRRNCVY
jgi:hypothetical protein